MNTKGNIDECAESCLRRNYCVGFHYNPIGENECAVFYTHNGSTIVLTKVLQMPSKNPTMAYTRCKGINVYFTKFFKDSVKYT